MSSDGVQQNHIAMKVTSKSLERHYDQAVRPNRIFSLEEQNDSHRPASRGGHGSLRSGGDTYAVAPTLKSSVSPVEPTFDNADNILAAEVGTAVHHPRSPVRVRSD